MKSKETKAQLDQTVRDIYRLSQPVLYGTNPDAATRVRHAKRMVVVLEKATEQTRDHLAALLVDSLARST